MERTITNEIINRKGNAKMKKNYGLLLFTAALLVSCGGGKASSEPEADKLEEFIAALKGDNMTVTTPDYAKMEYFGNTGVYYNYLGDYALYSKNEGTFVVPNVGFCSIDEDKNVTIAFPVSGEHNLSELYFMPSVVGTTIESASKREIADQGDGEYKLYQSDALASLAMLAGFDEWSAFEFTEGSLTAKKDGSYELYLFLDNSESRELYGLTEEDMPDVESTSTISKIGMTTENDIAEFAKTYVPVGLSNGLSAEQKATIDETQDDAGFSDVFGTLSFTNLSFFELAEGIGEWHLMDYGIGNVAPTLREMMAERGYVVDLDAKLLDPDYQNDSMIFYKYTTETDSETGETWTSKYSRFTYAYMNPETFHTEPYDYPEWTYTGGRSAFAGSSGEYMKPSFCLASWNALTDANGNAIPTYVPGIAIDKTTFTEEYGVSFDIRFTDTANNYIEGEAYDKVLEAAGWTGEGWNRFSETFAYSDRSTEPNENGDYTQITISASETGLDFSIYSYNVYDEYYY